MEKKKGTMSSIVSISPCLHPLILLTRIVRTVRLFSQHRPAGGSSAIHHEAWLRICESSNTQMLVAPLVTSCDHISWNSPFPISIPSNSQGGGLCQWGSVLCWLSGMFRHTSRTVWGLTAHGKCTGFVWLKRNEVVFPRLDPTCIPCMLLDSGLLRATLVSGINERVTFIVWSHRTSPSKRAKYKHTLATKCRISKIREHLFARQKVLKYKIKPIHGRSSFAQSIKSAAR